MRGTYDRDLKLLSRYKNEGMKGSGQNGTSLSENSFYTSAIEPVRLPEALQKHAVNPSMEALRGQMKGSSIIVTLCSPYLLYSDWPKVLLTKSG